VISYRKQLNEQSTHWERAQFQIDAHDETLAETQQKIGEEEDRIRNITAHLERDESIRHQDGRILSDTEVQTQLRTAIARLNALRGTKNEVAKQRAFISRQQDGFHEEMVSGPSRLIELQAGLELLRTTASFHRDRLRTIDREGKPANLRAAYREAKLALNSAMAPFRDPPTAIVPIEFRTESIATRREQMIHEANVALGISREQPATVVAAH
jgi:chromosome segregation ATPase